MSLRDVMMSLQTIGQAVTDDNAEAYSRAIEQAEEIGVTERQILDAYHWRNLQRMRAGKGPVGFGPDGNRRDTK